MKIIGLYDQSRSRERNLVRFTGNPVAFPSQCFTKNTCQRRALDGTAFEGVADNPLIAEGGELHLVALHIDADLFQDQERRHPAGATDARDPDALTLEIGGGFDLRPGHQFTLYAVGEGRDHSCLLYTSDAANERSSV